jgi:hypothetical protein
VDDAPFTVAGSYLAETDYELAGDRGGIAFRFVSRRFPLESCSRALGSAGIAIEVVREPPLPAVERHRRTHIPVFVMWGAVRVASDD